MDFLVRHFAGTFFGVVVFGVVAIVFLGGQVAHSSSTITLLGLMGLFAAVIWRKRNSPYAGEADGDSFYYLGFIYTLATLVAAFLPSLNSKEQLSEQEIVSFFGLGLVTTFVGLVGRILFTHYKASSRSSIEDSIHGLNVAVRTLSSEVLVAAQQIASYSQSTKKELSAISDEAGASLRAHAAMLGTSLTNSLGRIEAVLGDFAVRTQQSLSENSKIAAASLDALRNELSVGKNSLMDFNKAITDSSKKTQVQLGRWNTALEDQTKQISKNTAAYLQIGEAIQNPLGIVNGVVETIGVTLETIRQNVSSFDVAIRGLNSATASAVDVQKELHDSIAIARRTHDELLSKLRSDQEMIARHRERLEEALKDSDEAVLKVFKHLTESAELTVKRIRTGKADE